MRRKLAENEDEQIVALHQQGKSLEAIASVYGVHRNTISRILQRHGRITNPVVMPTIPDTVTLAYYAGIFDGEGHITVGASKRINRTDYCTPAKFVPIAE